jgi:hypothetical protein
VLSYPVGIAAPAAAAIWLLMSSRLVPLHERIRRCALAVIPSILAIGLLFAVHEVTVGHWNAYFLLQETYEHDLRNPLTPTRQAIESLFGSAPFSLLNMKNLESLLVGATLVSVSVYTLVRRRQRAEWEVLIVLWAIATWLIPHATTHVDLSRAEAALLPLAILVARLPGVVAGSIVVAAIALSVPLEVSYLQGKIELL